MNKIKYFFTVFLFLTFSMSFGQNSKVDIKVNAINPNSNSSEKTVVSSDKQAEPVGGIKKFYTDLSSTLQVPELEISGTFKTKVKFLVNQDGSLSDFQVIEEKPTNVGLGLNVIKYLQTTANWIPGEQNGRKVKTYFVLPVTTVILSEPETELKKKN